MGTLPTITPPAYPNPNQQIQTFLFNYPQNNTPNPADWVSQGKANRQLNEEIAWMQAQIQQQEAIQMLIDSGFPSQSYLDKEGTVYFYPVAEEITAMLKGEKPLNFGRSVFLVENAFYGNKMDYSEYQKFINHKAA